MSATTDTLTSRLTEVLAAAPPRSVAPRGEVIVPANPHFGRWGSYRLEWLKVQWEVYDSTVDGVGPREFRLRFTPCCFGNGDQSASPIAPASVLSHVSAEQIAQEIERLVAATGDMQFSILSVKVARRHLP